MRATIATSLVLIAACGKGDSKQADPGTGSAGSAAGPVETLDKLEVLVDGKPVPMHRAFIKRVSPDQWRLMVADDEGSCDELVSGVTTRKPGATSFVATIGKRVKPDGTEVTTVLDLWSGGHLSDAVLASATITGNADKGTKVGVELGKMVDANKTRKIEVKGSFDALGCGDQPAPPVGLPKANHPSTGKITIAGKSLPLAGAIRRGDDFVLTTGPRDCTPPTVAAQVALARTEGKWTLTGTWVSDVNEVIENNGDDTKTAALKITPGSTGSSVDGATVNLALAGAGKVGDYAVELDGSIEAIDCRKP